MRRSSVVVPRTIGTGIEGSENYTACLFDRDEDSFIALFEREKMLRNNQERQNGDFLQI
jgi:hypothetical protein